MRTRSVCIFAGAGCSRALARLPVQADLARQLADWEGRQSHPHFSRELHRLLEKLEDLELILSHYQNRAYPRRGRGGSYRQDLMFLRVALAGFLDEELQTRADTTVQESAQLLEQFLQNRGFAQEDIFVVTTNYDLVLERIFERLFGPGSWCHPGLTNDSDSPGRIPIFKLHGSINWMEDRGQATIVGASRTSIPRIVEPSTMSLTPVAVRRSGYYFVKEDRKFTPILIPPLYQKEHWLRQDNEYWSQIFNRTWNDAFRGMGASTSRLFWGYSLPPIDLDMFTRLMSAFEATPADVQVEIVDERDNTPMIRFGRYLDLPIKTFADGLVNYWSDSQT